MFWQIGSARTNLRTEGEITKHSNDLVDPDCRANRCAYDDVHATLRIVYQFIVDREKLCR